MRKKFDKEFKKKVVEISYASGNASKFADELGIDRALLYRDARNLVSIKPIAYRGTLTRR